MVMKKSDGFQMAKLQTLLLPVAAISMVFVMIIPVPSVVLDILLAASITASVIVFLTAVQVRRGVDFFLFSSMAVLLRLFRFFRKRALERMNTPPWYDGCFGTGSRI